MLFCFPNLTRPKIEFLHQNDGLIDPQMKLYIDVSVLHDLNAILVAKKNQWLHSLVQKIELTAQRVCSFYK